MNLDVTHSELLSLSPEGDDDDDLGPLDGGADPSLARCAPDVLIVPSRLKHFSKVGLAAIARQSWRVVLTGVRQIVDNTVAINPSFLSKSMYAMLNYEGHTIPGPAKDRIKVEISRLEGVGAA